MGVWDRRYLGGVWLEAMQLVHSQAQLAEVDVEVHHHVSRQRGCEHFLGEGQSGTKESWKRAGLWKEGWGGAGLRTVLSSRGVRQAHHQPAGGQLGERHGGRSGEAAASARQLQHHRVHQLLQKHTR